jgi:hypothetical protein
VAPGGTDGRTAGAWRLVRAAGGGSALCRDDGADRWRPLGAAAADFDVRLRARTEPGATEQYGLAFRRGESGDYYLARVDTRNNNVRLYRRQAGATTLLAARDLGVTVGQWHELAVQALGGRLAVALDGEPQLQAADAQLRTGGVALWADSETRVCFDRLWVAPRGSNGGGAASQGANGE